MSITPFISAQTPVSTSSVYAFSMKNWPLIQNARMSIRMPLMRPSHHSGLPALAISASIVHMTPTIRNKKPRMSAMPANVFSGLTNERMPAPTRSTAKIADSQRRLSPNAASTSWPNAANMNRQPARMPMVLIEAASNWSTTNAAPIQMTPVTSHSHQKPLMSRPTADDSDVPSTGLPECGRAELLTSDLLRAD